MRAIDHLLNHATLVHEPASAPLLGMLLERAGHDLGPTAHAGTKVLDARVVERDVLLVRMAAPHMGGFELMGVARRLAPISPTIAVSLSVERYATPGAALADATHWPEAVAAALWNELIDRVAETVPQPGAEGEARPATH